MPVTSFIYYASAVMLIPLLCVEVHATATEGGRKGDPAMTESSSFSCRTISEKSIVPRTGTGNGVVWWKGNCTGTTPYGSVGPIIVNALTVDLTDDSLVLEPLIAPQRNTSTGATGLASLPDIMSQDSRMIAGVNGGYFFRVDLNNFFDDVCFGKTQKQALTPVGNGSNPSDGIGDGTIVKQGKLLATNCNNDYGYNRPTTLVLNGSASRVVIQHTADPPPAGADNCLAAGPNLVSVNETTGKSYVHIPKKDENVNILGHSANTAVGLRGKPGAFSELVMLTVDGTDSCSPFDDTCGISAYPLASLMKDWANCSVAMNMDQGGSTTMVIKDEGPKVRKGVVSCSHEPDCDGAGRILYSGLFVGIRK